MDYLAILKYLNETFDANFYLVGGFLRDKFSDIKSEDYDIATDLTPEVILKIAEEKGLKVFPTGLQHGTLTLLYKNKNLEITTFRKDLENNGRHAKVEFTKSIKEDSKRRDFTINALYLDENNQVYDFHSGLADLKKGRVKFIGSADERINEDYLRLLRFFRFYADFDKGGISLREPGLKEVISKNAVKIENLSSDRITQEIIKACESRNFAKYFATMANFDALIDILKLNVHTLNSKELDITENLDSFFKLTLIYRNNLKPLLDNKNFNFSNKQKKQAKQFIASSSFKLDEDSLVEDCVRYGKKAVIFKIMSSYLNGDLLKIEVSEFLGVVDKDLPEFPVSGRDLLDIGIAQDKNLGNALHLIKNYWVENRFPNKDKCLKFARKIKENSL